MRTEITNLGGDGWVHSGGQGFSPAARPVPVIAGGEQPEPARRTIMKASGEVIDANELSSYPWQNGDHLQVITQGGCGVGDPLTRDPQAVRLDVIEEKVSIEAAERQYAVVLDAGTLEVDETQTARLRSERDRRN